MSDQRQRLTVPWEISSFRANCLFRNFEIQGPADRTLIYLILFTHDCLTRVAPSPGKPSPAYPEATKVLQTLAVDHFSVPGEAGFPLNSLYKGPSDKAQTGEPMRIDGSAARRVVLITVSWGMLR